MKECEVLCNVQTEVSKEQRVIRIEICTSGVDTLLLRSNEKYERIKQT